MALEIERALVPVDRGLDLVGGGLGHPMVRGFERRRLGGEEVPNLILAGECLGADVESRVVGPQQHHHVEVVGRSRLVPLHLDLVDRIQVRLTLQVCLRGGGWRGSSAPRQ